MFRLVDEASFATSGVDVLTDFVFGDASEPGFDIAEFLGWLSSFDGALEGFLKDIVDRIAGGKPGGDDSTEPVSVLCNDLLPGDHSERLLSLCIGPASGDFLYEKTKNSPPMRIAPVVEMEYFSGQ